jgi:hypothetical protein
MPGHHPVASRRIIRLAFGTAIALWVSQAVAWGLSFITPVLVLFLLSLPLPAPGLKSGIKFVLALVVSVYAGLLLLPVLEYQRMVGILLLVMACFWSFYYSARGGSPVLGAFLTVGIGIVTAVGSDSIDAALMVNKALALNAVIGMGFVWLAHALFPELPLPQNMPARPKPQAPPREQSIRSAWRATVIVFPVILFFLLYAGSASYLVVMIKVASMGQQVENDKSKAAGKSLLMSTFIGGIGAIIMWNLLRAWPSLILYTLLIALGGLIMGRRIFQGMFMHPRGGMWSYAFLTMLVIIAPAVMDTAGGAAADAKFFDRLLMMIWATLYGVAAVYVFDAFWPAKRSIERHTVVE